MKIGITFNNDTNFSLSNKDEGVSVVGNITDKNFEHFVKTYALDIMDVFKKNNIDVI